MKSLPLDWLMSLCLQGWGVLLYARLHNGSNCVLARLGCVAVRKVVQRQLFCVCTVGVCCCTQDCATAAIFGALGLCQG